MRLRPTSFVSLLPVIYLVFALPVVLFQVFGTPPFQVADEENHFLRALQIAEGHPIAHRLDETAAGGELEPDAVQAAHAFDELKFHPERKLDTARYGEVAGWSWNLSDKSPASFANTAIYPPFFYLPASLGLKLGQLGGLTILDSVYLARLMNAVTATFLAGLAIAICARGRSALFVILSFPMVLSLFAGISPDAQSIASGALVVAIWSHYASRDTDIPFLIRCGAAVLLGAIIAARMPLIPLFGLLLVPTSSARPPLTRAWLRRADLIACALGLVPIAIGAIGARAAKIAFKPDAGVSPFGQLAFILHHPGADLRVATLTLQSSGQDYLQQIVGVLGWLDTPLPALDYAWFAFWLVMALLVECSSPARALALLARLALACMIIAAAAAVFGALYLAWTPVGNPTVDGVQGRYFLFPALCVLLTLPGLPLWRGRTPGGGYDGVTTVATARLAICFIVAAANIWIVPVTILHRYYGP